MDASTTPILYACFLALTCLFYWVVPQRGWRLGILLAASLVFYTSLQVMYLPLLVADTLLTFALALAIGENEPPKPKKKVIEYGTNGHRSASVLISYQSPDPWHRRRRFFLWTGIVANLLVLVGFKYGYFLTASLEDATGAILLSKANANALGQLSWLNDSLVIPLGLSFFVFECIAYLVDVYRGAAPSRQWLEFATYKLFFPKLIAGPITRFHLLAEQWQTLPRSPRIPQVSEGLWLIAVGAVKKGAIADHLAIYVNLSFENLQRASSTDLWLALLTYGLQLYLDFSGYVDIARGSALLLGLTLPINFDFPYAATSIADFWRRWHITLGNWLRDYLYIPLGGSRQGLFRTCINLVIVMVLAGLWHGKSDAQFHPAGFVIWGGLHGLALVAHRLTDAAAKSLSWLQSFWKSFPGTLLAWGITQTMVFTSWLFFRLPNPPQYTWAMQHLWGYSGDIQFAEKIYLEALGMERLEYALVLGAIALLMALAFVVQRGMKLHVNLPIKLLLVPLCLYAVWLLAPQESLPHIYFEF